MKVCGIYPGFSSARRPACLLVLLLSATAAPAADGDPVGSGFSVLETQVRVSWRNMTTMALGGVPVHYRTFLSRMPVHGTAEAFARESGMFDRVLAFKDRVVLSGVRNGWHWVVDIGPESSGARGLVSAMPLNPVAAWGAPMPAVGAAPDWLPAGSRLYFEQTLNQAGMTVRQSIHRLPQPPAAVGDAVTERLAGLGWSRMSGEPGSEHGQMEVWVRERSRLMFAIVPDVSGSALFVQLRG